MIPIPDDPIVRSIERTGYAPWFDEDPNDFEEVVEEHDDYWNNEPFAVYDPDW